MSRKGGTFAEGYHDGWKSVFGQGAALPAIPAYALPIGKTAYEHGYDEGRRAATNSRDEIQIRTLLNADRLAPARRFSQESAAKWVEAIDAGNGRKEACGSGDQSRHAGGAGGELRRLRAHRQPAGGLRPALLRRRGQAGRGRQARRRGLDRGRAEGGARLRHQPAGADQGRARRPRQGAARGAARRLHQCDAGFPRRRPR